MEHPEKWNVPLQVPERSSPQSEKPVGVAFQEMPPRLGFPSARDPSRGLVIKSNSATLADTA